MADDLYQVLEVTKQATADEIRKSYKKLSRKYHPDRNPDDGAAEKKFKQIQAAYSVLGDDEKRKKYDQYGASWEHAQRGGHPFQGGPGGSPVDLSDLFGDSGIDLADLFGGAFGFGGGGQQRRSSPRPVKGEDARMTLEIPFLLAANGGQHDFRMQRGRQSERLSVKIPAGVDTGSVVRLSGQGHPSHNGGPSGDLMVELKVARHPWFHRDGNDLSIDVPITPAEAVLGTKVEVPTLDEGPIVISVPPGTSSGQKLRLKGKGVPDKKTKVRGNLYAMMKIVVPKTSSESAQALYQQLADLDEPNPRAGLW